MTGVEPAGMSATLWRYTKAMPGFIFGTESETMGEALRKSYAGVKGQTEGLRFKHFGTQVKDAFELGVQNHEAAVAANGGFFKNLWNDLSTIPKDISRAWTGNTLEKEAADSIANLSKAGKKAEAAKALADFQKKYGYKSLKEAKDAIVNLAKGTKLGIPAKLKGIAKVFGKRMPLIGTLIIAATELPNIVKATYNDGLLAGGAEVAKTGVRLGCGAIGGAIGSALIPIPLVGSLVGYAVGDLVGKFVVGKSYSEKQAAKNNANTADAAQNTKVDDFKIDTQNVPFGGFDTGINDEAFARLQQEYQMAAGINNNPFNMNYMNNPINTNYNQTR